MSPNVIYPLIPCWTEIKRILQTHFPETWVKVHSLTINQSRRIINEDLGLDIQGNDTFPVAVEKLRKKVNELNKNSN